MVHPALTLSLSSDVVEPCPIYAGRCAKGIQGWATTHPPAPSLRYRAKRGRIKVPSLSGRIGRGFRGG